MELIKSIKNTLQFISTVQDSCDKHRKCMESLWLEEYNIYINNWKQNQIEQKKHTERKKCENNHLKAEDLEELEELVLADSLLRKARNIRLKHQKSLNGIIDIMNMPTSSSVSHVPVVKHSEKTNSKKRIPQSKSDYAISRSKNTVVPRSKSASGILVPKENSKSYNSRKYSSVSLNCNQINLPEKTLDDQTVISSKDLESFKRLHISLPTCHELKPPNRSGISDSPKNSAKKQILPHPSSREFLNVVKGKLSAVSSHFKLKVWYPFLSYKSEIILTSVECTAFCTVKKTSTILYIIQETMMWIDLLYLMENEIYPNVVFDMKDTKKIRVCSYLLSIFNRNGQRMPMLDPNR